MFKANTLFEFYPKHSSSLIVTQLRLPYSPNEISYSIISWYNLLIVKHQKSCDLKHLNTLEKGEAPSQHLALSLFVACEYSKILVANSSSVSMLTGTTRSDNKSSSSPNEYFVISDSPFYYLALRRNTEYHF